MTKLFRAWSLEYSRLISGSCQHTGTPQDVWAHVFDL
jgi:hypothetical protein